MLLLKNAIPQRYRADIDGLRAVAVLSVVGFHIFPERVTGGFVGVDIFYVISGYLISTIIFSAIQTDKFSFVEFYSRRIRRIFPALLVVLSASFAIGWHILLADEYKQLGKHIAGAAAFISNFILWRESGYFDTSTTTKPLLHLWSLGIEEQFYIAWPLLLVLTSKKRINPQLIIILTTTISFSFNIAIYQSSPVEDFYSPKTRFWELASGSLLASSAFYKNPFSERFYCALEGHLNKALHLPQKHTARGALRNFQSILGVTLIVISVFNITKQNEFPGILATIPVIGTIFVISAGADTWLNRFLLSNRVAVWFGTISYPLYLWHWPLLAFTYIVENSIPGYFVRIATAVISIALAWATYTIIERPIRFGTQPKKKTIVLFSLMSLVGFTGCLTYLTEGIPDRLFVEQHNTISEAVSDWKWPAGLNKFENDGLVLYGNSTQPPKILIVGDSHVMQFGPRVVHLGQNTKMPPVAFMTDIGCPLVPFVFDDERHQHCRPFVDKFRELLKKSLDIRKIVIGGCWNCYFIDQTKPSGLVHHPQTFKLVNDPQNFYYEKSGARFLFRGSDGKKLAIASLKEMLADLSKNYSVYLLLDNPNGEFFNPRNILRNRLNITRRIETDTINLSQEQLNLNNELRSIALGAGARVVDQIRDLCPNNKCFRLDKFGRPIYKDENHLRSSFVIETKSRLDDVFLE
ncbi:acyltransferase family protein [Methylococcus sp. ANG]|uniref:acyltransferase family protein n=1 Tax=unclassified Methylococcus TaxID=2618889 RepID=UPI001C532145|nr:acyltransferase family protein [Methylococcus sp. Mc7]QXP82652.1 acyltransferase [Methylococcus sp. Mc7]